MSIPASTFILTVVAFLMTGGLALTDAEPSQTASAQVTFPSRDKPTQLTGHLYHPQGPGPFATVILLHGCGGIFPRHHGWARQLRDWGYLTLVVDSLGPRNVPDICDEVFLSLNRIDVHMRVLDVYGAWDYLRALPEVDAGRMGLIGWSHGGITILTALNRVLVETFDWPRQAFRVAVAWYPLCGGDGVTTPLLILIGDQDDWTPARACQQMLRDLSPASAPVQLQVYPGAYHGFDRLGASRVYRGHVLERHDTALAQAQMEMKAFLAHYLASGEMGQ